MWHSRKPEDYQEFVSIPNRDYLELQSAIVFDRANNFLVSIPNRDYLELQFQIETVYLLIWLRFQSLIGII